MAVGWTCSVLLASVFLIHSSVFAESSGCPKNRKDLDSDQLLIITTCSGPNAESINHRTTDWLPTGTTCEVKCLLSDVRSWRQCDHALNWTGPRVNCGAHNTATRHRSKRGWGWFKAIFKAVVCFFANCRGGGKPPDRTKPRLTCPPDITRVADPIQVNTKVWWTEPDTAWDDRDGNVPVKRSGMSPGLLFSEGSTTVGYYAKDRSGNMATCSMRITIRVTRCTRLRRLSDGFYVCHPSADMRRGGRCWFGCYDGHELTPNIERITCQDSGQWDNQQPSCKKIECPNIIPSSGLMSMSCTEGTKFRSICTYSCVDGYDIPTGSIRVRVCSADRTWRGAEPTCVDVSPPVFTTCPYYAIGYTDKGSNTGRVHWQDPRVEDNAGKIEAVHISGPRSGDVLIPGVYTSVYEATDSAGNKAKQCKVKVVMKLLTCHRLYPRPYTSIVCLDGVRFGSECSFNCDHGAVFPGEGTTTSATCLKSWSDPPYGYWSFYNDQPYCEFVSKCEDLNPPGHGALTCDNWMGGTVCVMMCETGYDISPRNEYHKQFVCGNSGEWTPINLTPDLPDCIRIQGRPEKHKLRMTSFYYFNGSCSDEQVTESIKGKFITILKASAFTAWCEVPACTADNVDVFCGSRVERSAGAIANNILEIHLGISVGYGPNDTVESTDIARSGILNSIYEVATSETFRSEVGSEFNLIFHSARTDPLEVVCPHASVPSTSGECVVCAAGTYHNPTGTGEHVACEDCPKGTYQPDSAQEHCIPCPISKTTRRVGAKSESECLDGCSPGSFSVDGVKPCSLCGIDSYQSGHGASSCSVCPNARITRDEGAVSEDMCVAFDIEFTSTDIDVIAVLDHLNVTVNDAITVGFWVICMDCTNPELLSLESAGGGTLAVTGWEEMILLHNGIPMLTGNGFNDGRWHSVGLVIGTTHVLVYLDGKEVFSTPMFVALSPLSTVIIGGSGMQGSVSQLNIWHGSKTNLLQESSRNCFDSGLGDLVNWQMFAEANITRAFLQTPSECDDFDSCLSSPCRNGKCFDTLGGFTCSCDPGFTGVTCSDDVDDCTEHACQNDGTCIDGTLDYTCICPYGFIGQLCETATVDGNWGDWGNWSECSVSCGHGMTSRVRVCDNPQPDRGKECQGVEEEAMNCIISPCPVCSVLNPPKNGFIDCDNNTESDTLECTIHCDEGYEFDREPMPMYCCGPETFYTWDFQTEDNPHAQLPSCTEHTNAMMQTVGYSNTYDGLTCTDDSKLDTVAHITDKLENAIETIPCISVGECWFPSLSVTNCQTSRQKRASDAINVGFSVDFSCDPNKVSSDGCFEILVGAIETMETAAQNGELSFLYSDTTYHILSNSSSVSGKALCAAGSVAYGHYCVPCGPGTYERESECVECDYGFYSDITEQLACKECPRGKTTRGIGSRALEECVVSVPVPPEDSSPTDYVILIGLPIITISLIVVVTVIIWRIKKVPKTVPHSNRPDDVKKKIDQPVFSVIQRLSWQSNRDSSEKKPPTPILVNNFMISKPRD
ncbi:hypothetical protein ScPMuIL_010962 [Solemya velum]